MSARAGAMVTGLVWLLTSMMASAQSDQQRPDDLLARVSYRSTYMVNGSDQQSPRICFALYRNGRYQLLKLVQGKNEVLEGTLSQDELDAISKILNSLDPGKSNKTGIVEKGSESLAAQLVRKETTTHYSWIDPDHQQPFPTAALSIIKWLQNFKPQRASRLRLHEMSEFSICPPPSMTPVPAVATVMRKPAGSGCGIVGR